MGRRSVVIVAAACLLTACGGDDDVASTNAVATTTTPGADTTAVASTAAGTTEPANPDAATTEATTATAISPPATTEYPERFDAKHVTVSPDGTDGLRIREVVDADFGSNHRHGYQRLIPNDFGVPTDVTAESPDAPDDLLVEQTGNGETLIRIGDPNTTISGQHRYVLTYTLPDAQLTSGQLSLDVGTDDALETGRAEVVVTGLELQDLTCNVGSPGTSGGCTLERDGDVYRTVISPLAARQGITIAGTITGRTTPTEVPEPSVPPHR